MEDVMSYYELSSGAENTAKMITTELIQMNQRVFEDRKPSFDPKLDYKKLLFNECETQEILKVCLGEALIQIDEIQKEYDRITHKNYEIELKLNPKWKKRRRNF